MKKRFEDRYGDIYLGCLTKGQIYAFVASDCIMSVEEVLSSIVSFDKCRMSCWSEAYKKGYDDAYREMLDELENIAKNRTESKGAAK